MSHGGFGGHGHHGGHHHHGHHSGTGHHGGILGHMIDASVCLDFLHNIFAEMFPTRFKKRQRRANGGEDWEASLDPEPETMKEKLLHMDLTPFVVLVVF